MLACTNPKKTTENNNKNALIKKTNSLDLSGFLSRISKNNDDLGSATLEIRYWKRKSGAGFEVTAYHAFGRSDRSSPDEQNTSINCFIM
jgi:hypothetical protein